MNQKEKFDNVMKRVLSLGKKEMQRRLSEDSQRIKIGKKRGPKTSASPSPGVSGSH